LTIDIRIGDCREILRAMPAETVHCCVTSPPYFGLRDYGVTGQIGLEPTPDAFVAEMVAVFREVRRVLRDDGTCWLNLGDSYNNRTKVRTTSHQPALNGFVDDNWAERAARGGVRMSHNDGDLKEKDLLGVPWMVAFALRADGWYLRQDIIWSKPNPMPESVTDRCTKAHEYLFLLSKSPRYWYDAEAISEAVDLEYLRSRWGGSIERTGGNGLDTVARSKPTGKSCALGVGKDGKRNRRSVWTVATQPFSEAHFATFPPALIEPCIKAGCPVGGTVLDPFGGAGTTGLVADRLGRNAILIELNPAYADMAHKRIQGDCPMFAEVAAQ
jgi:DNA modification methylase